MANVDLRFIDWVLLCERMYQAEERAPPNAATPQVPASPLAGAPTLAGFHISYDDGQCEPHLSGVKATTRLDVLLHA